MGDLVRRSHLGRGVDVTSGALGPSWSITQIAWATHWSASHVSSMLATRVTWSVLPQPLCLATGAAWVGHPATWPPTPRIRL